MTPTRYNFTKARVSNRGNPPDAFLDQLVTWARTAPADIFGLNTKIDIYSSLRPNLGPWMGIPHRRAAMCEALRVLAGFESSWSWKEGVDITNARSMSHIEGEESGAFQVSFDSTLFDLSLRECVKKFCAGRCTALDFIREQKAQPMFALEYTARLLRFTLNHNGPVKRKEINLWVRRAAVQEFMELLA